MCTARHVPAARIGVVDGTRSSGLEVQGQFSVPLAELRDASEATFPRLFD